MALVLNLWKETHNNRDAHGFQASFLRLEKPSGLPEYLQIETEFLGQFDAPEGCAKRTYPSGLKVLVDRIGEQVQLYFVHGWPCAGTCDGTNYLELSMRRKLLCSSVKHLSGERNLRDMNAHRPLAITCTTTEEPTLPYSQSRILPFDRLLSSRVLSNVVRKSQENSGASSTGLQLTLSACATT